MGSWLRKFLQAPASGKGMSYVCGSRELCLESDPEEVLVLGKLELPSLSYCHRLEQLLRSCQDTNEQADAACV